MPACSFFDIYVIPVRFYIFHVTRHVTNLSGCMLVTFETPCFLKKNKRLFKDELFFSGV